MVGDKTLVHHRVIPALLAVLALLLPTAFGPAPAYAVPPPRHVDVRATDESDPLNLFRLIFRHRHCDLRPPGEGRFGWASNTAEQTYERMSEQEQDVARRVLLPECGPVLRPSGRG